MNIQLDDNEFPTFDTPELAIKWAEDKADDNADCIRFTYLDDVSSVREYMEIAADGCCGSADHLVVVSGKWALVGCNYGH